MTDRKAQKLREAAQHLEEAQKHLKTGFFKWRPDYDSAAVSYQNAALAFKLAKDFEKAKDAYEKLADAHFKLGARFHCAKAYEEAGNACKELNKYNLALGFFDRASDMYLENGTPDTAALCLERAGKSVELVNYEWAIQMYMKAADICENEEESKHRQAAEYLDRVARIQVQHSKLLDAVKTITKQCQLYSQFEKGADTIPRLTCSLVLVHLHIGDSVSAEQAIYIATDYADSFDGTPEQDALTRMVEAYNDEDQDKLVAITNTPMFKFMDNAYAKLARSLRVPAYTSITKAPAVAGINPPAQTQEHIDALQKDVDVVVGKMSNLTSHAQNLMGDNAGGISMPQNPPPPEEDDFDLT